MSRPHTAPAQPLRFGSIHVYASRRDVLELAYLREFEHDPDRAGKLHGHAKNLMYAFSRGGFDICAQFGVSGFPVVELINVIKGIRFVTYLSIAEDKFCLLYICRLEPEGMRRVGRERALLNADDWIAKCPRRAAHGQPVLVDYLGRPI